MRNSSDKTWRVVLTIQSLNAQEKYDETYRGCIGETAGEAIDSALLDLGGRLRKGFSVTRAWAVKEIDCSYVTQVEPLKTAQWVRSGG